MLLTHTHSTSLYLLQRHSLKVNNYSKVYQLTSVTICNKKKPKNSRFLVEVGLNIK